MGKNDYFMKSLLILVGLIACLTPIIHDYNLYSKIGQIAMGVSLIISATIKNKLIKGIVALIAAIIILYSYFSISLFLPSL